MPEPAASASTPAATALTAASPPPTETGLAAGRWEAPAWAFWAVMIAAVVAGMAWVAVAVRGRGRPGRTG